MEMLILFLGFPSHDKRSLFISAGLCVCRVVSCRRHQCCYRRRRNCRFRTPLIPTRLTLSFAYNFRRLRRAILFICAVLRILTKRQLDIICFVRARGCHTVYSISFALHHTHPPTQRHSLTQSVNFSFGLSSNFTMCQNQDNVNDTVTVSSTRNSQIRERKLEEEEEGWG